MKELIYLVFTTGHGSSHLCAALRSGFQGFPLQVLLINPDIRVNSQLAEFSVHGNKVADCDVANQPVCLVIEEPRMVFLHL